MTAISNNTDGVLEERQSIEQAIASLLGVCDLESSKKGLQSKLQTLQRKLSFNRFHLAVLGQMKRGKSSFVNALLGAEVLPTGVLPVTAAITEIKYSGNPAATIIYTTCQSESVPLTQLADYITEDGNPGNKKQVASVEVGYPSSFLKAGIVLIDTPGIGSTHAHNSRTTEGYLEKIDAAIVVLSVDPPITQLEAEFLARVKGDIPKCFFVLNKVDLATPAEISSISRFLLDELENRLQFESPQLFALSARQALSVKPHGENSLCNGIKEFEERLMDFLAKEKEQVLVRSIALDVITIARAMRFATALGIRAKAMSLEALASKDQTLNRLVAQAELELRELHILLRQRTADILAQIEEELKFHAASSIPELRQRLKALETQHPKETGRDLGVVLESFLMQTVEEIFRKWRIQEDARIGSELHSLSHRFVAQANGILDRLQLAVSALFELPIEQFSISCDLDVESHLYYRVDPIFYSLDTFFLWLPGFLLRPIVFHKVDKSLDSILDRNAGRIRCDYLERIEKSINKFDRDLHVAVSSITESLKSALHTPHQIKQSQSLTLDLLDSVIANCARTLS